MESEWTSGMQCVLNLVFMLYVASKTNGQEAIMTGVTTDDSNTLTM